MPRFRLAMFEPKPCNVDVSSSRTIEIKMMELGKLVLL